MKIFGFSKYSARSLTKNFEIKVVRYDLSVEYCKVVGLFLNISKMHREGALSQQHCSEGDGRGRNPFLIR